MDQYEGDYLEGPTYLDSEAQIAYFKVCSEMEKAKALDDFEMAKRKAIIGIQAFRNYCTTLIRLCSAGNISFTDMRAELVKVGVHYKKLREEAIEVESRFFTIKDMDLATRFKDLVGEELRKCKEVGLANWPAETTVGDRISRSKDILCTTKKNSYVAKIQH